MCAFLVWTGSGADLGAGGPTAVVPPSSGWSRRGRPELRSLRRWTRSLWVYILLEGPFLHLLLLLLLLLLLIPLLLILLVTTDVKSLLGVYTTYDVVPAAE